MEVTLLGHKAKVDWISARMASKPWHPEETICVWFEFTQPGIGLLGSTLSFAIEIEPKDYNPDEFLKVITEKGEEELEKLIQGDRARQEETRIFQENRKRLNKMIIELGEKLGIPSQLITR